MIALFGNTRILIFIAITLIASSLLLYAESPKVKVFSLLLFFIYFVFSNHLNLTIKEEINIHNVIDVDTNYNHVRIFDYTGPPFKLFIKVMQINNELSSGMFVNTSELIPGHNTFYRQLSKHFNPKIEAALMIGGAGYDYPKDFLNQYKEATMDVVEIDPKVTELARQYFRLADNPCLTIFHEDGRIFLNRNQKKYDAVFIDAFNSYVVPHHLTTRETVQRIYDSLTEGGVVLVNLKSGLAGRNLRFLKAIKATYESVFPQVFIFPVADPRPTELVQNIILVGLKSTQKPRLESDDKETARYLKHLFTQNLKNDLPLLTDEYAPVESYQSYGLQELRALFRKKFSSLLIKARRFIDA